MTSVGIDVSKSKSTVCILRPYGEVIASPYEIQHTGPEIQELVSRIREMEGAVRIVMEATGAYHLPLLSSFKDRYLKQYNTFPAMKDLFILLNRSFFISKSLLGGDNHSGRS